MTQVSRITLLRPGIAGSAADRLAEDVGRGLSSEPKELPPKYFYDARGSELFERITELPEYYLTRREREILDAYAGPLVERHAPAALVEFGSGSSVKTRILLDAMHDAGCLVGYGPVDVSESAIEGAGEALMERYPELTVVGVIADFEGPIQLPFDDLPRLIAFLGSTIGNLDEPSAVAFLSRVAGQLRPAERFLVGFDLVKAESRLEAAYNDAAGVTAEFNRNVLAVINRELGADFDLEEFGHRAVYNARESLIEMHLISSREQRIRIDGIGLEVRFRAGESVLTERSRKYTRLTATHLFARAGLVLEEWTTDARGDFALGLFRSRSSQSRRWG